MANFFAPTALTLGPQLEPWQPESKFETFGSGLDVSNLIPAGEEFDIKKLSIAFLSQRESVDSDTLFYRTGYEDDITKHAFVGQTYNNIPFTEAQQGHVVYTKRNNKVVSVTSTFVKITATASISYSKPLISFQDAIKTAETELQGKYTPDPSTASTADVGGDIDKKFQQYLANPDGSATLVYTIPVSNDSTGTSFLGYVDAHEGKVAAAINYVVQNAS